MDAIRWGDKRKLLALLAVAKVSGADSLTSQIEGLSRDVLSVMVSDATVAGLCHDLYETLMKSALPQGRSEVPNWIREWIEPLFKSHGDCSELNRLRMSAMQLDDEVTFYAAKLESEGTCFSDVELENRLKIGMMGLRIIKQRTVNSKEYLENECFKRALTCYSDEVHKIDCYLHSSFCHECHSIP